VLRAVHCERVGCRAELCAVVVVAAVACDWQILLDAAWRGQVVECLFYIPAHSSTSQAVTGTRVVCDLAQQTETVPIAKNSTQVLARRVKAQWNNGTNKSDRMKRETSRCKTRLRRTRLDGDGT